MNERQEEINKGRREIKKKETKKRCIRNRKGEGRRIYPFHLQPWKRYAAVLYLAQALSFH